MKKPGFEHILEERAFSFFLYEKETKVQYVEEYAKILYAAMEGNQSLFISPKEVEALWKFTDPIKNLWNQNVVPLAEYEPNTTPHPAILQTMPDTREKHRATRAGERFQRVRRGFKKSIRRGDSHR